MYREILPIWGPFSINSFGLCIAVGLVIFTWLFVNNSARKALINDDQLSSLLTFGIIATLCGGRFLYIIQNWHFMDSIVAIIALWNGGLSILGGIIGCLLFVLLYSTINRIPIFPLFDVIALYAPIIQTFGRLGCFCAGCCHGTFCCSWYAVTYTDPNSFAPLNIPLHPTQLYSALSLFVLFWILHILARKKLPTGTILGAYLLLSSTERFIIDFWRADREFVQGGYCGILSLHQWIALLIIIAALALLYFNSSAPSHCESTHEPV